jgi:hypothetical protein
MTIQLDRRPLVAGANGGGIKAPFKSFSKLLQNSRVLLQAFPNKALAILCDFNWLQGFQTSFDAFHIFRLRPPAFGRILLFGKKYPQFSRAVIDRFAPASGRSPWMKRAFRFSVHSGASKEAFIDDAMLRGDHKPRRVSFDDLVRAGCVDVGGYVARKSDAPRSGKFILLDVVLVSTAHPTVSFDQSY